MHQAIITVTTNIGTHPTPSPIPSPTSGIEPISIGIVVAIIVVVAIEVTQMSKQIKSIFITKVKNQDPEES